MTRLRYAVAATAIVCARAAAAQTGTVPTTVPTPPERADIVVTGSALPLTTRVRGQTVTTLYDRDIRGTPATSVADLVRLSPGVAVLGGNGPRDVGVSIRGSNARNGFGARNIQVFEDDFPVTQPDGLARFDLTDPHAYGAIDVVRGPSSARYGNYALGGAINFRTRRGRDVEGLAVGTDVGGDGYANVYATIGDAGAGYDYSVFGSLVAGDGFTGHTGYRTGTINALGTFAIGARDRITGKIIHNEGEFRLSTRLSLNQYRANPYQEGCARAATAAAGCGTISVLVNGINGARIAQTASEGDLARDDRRMIVGVRHEHDLTDDTTWRTQGTFDSRVVSQPTSATPFKGTLNSYNVSSDVTGRATIAGREATLFAGVFHALLDNQSYSFNKTPAGRDGIGAPTQTVLGEVRLWGARGRVEVELVPSVMVIAGIGAERSVIDVRQIAYGYPVRAGASLSTIPAERRFWNVAPEAALAWQVVPALKLQTRIGTGYGIPQAGSLFVTPQGVPGNNAALKAQRNVGVDAGAVLTLATGFSAEVTGYQEWFTDELVTQSAGINLLAFTTNVPRSRHRGIEVGTRWRSTSGVSLGVSYSYNDQRYTDYIERLTGGGRSALIDRAGNRIPGVVPTFANARIGYDRGGFGGFVEATRRGRFTIDNGNLLSVPGYTLVNLNLHYDAPASPISLFASIQNLFDRRHVGAASVIADSLDATGRENGAAVLAGTTGTIFAGQPLTVFAGIRSRFGRTRP